MSEHELADWGDFLRIRHELIHRWRKEGKVRAAIYEALAMDLVQIDLIAATPLRPRDADPRCSTIRVAR